MTDEEIDRIEYWVCCPMCDNKICTRGTENCEAEIWAKKKKEAKMDKQEATQELMDLANGINLIPSSKKGQAIKMAIQALEDRGRCRWIDVPMGRYVLLHRCSKCSHCSDKASNYCPECGAKMEAENADNN